MARIAMFFVISTILTPLTLVSLAKGDTEDSPASTERDQGIDYGTYVEYQQARYPDATQILGMDTWYKWTAGNQYFWRGLTIHTEGGVDLFRLLLSVPRQERFHRLGVINDPACESPTKPDSHGLSLDQWKEAEKKALHAKYQKANPDKTLSLEEAVQMEEAVYGRPSGIIGLRLFKNPRFQPDEWDVTEYLKSPDQVEPPYLVGMSCAVCHVSFEPTNPPADIANPAWENLSPVVGNQFLEEGRLFTAGLTSENFVWHIANTQQPGTSDTSRISSDFINNPNAINSIYQLAARLELKAPEKISDKQREFLLQMPEEIWKEDFDPKQQTLKTAHVLKDGADSMGVAIASLRVYVNIGMFVLSPEEMENFKSGKPFSTMFQDSLATGAKGQARGVAQAPFRIADARSSPAVPGAPRNFWLLTEERMPAMEQFLIAASAMTPRLDAHSLQDDPLESFGTNVDSVKAYLQQDQDAVLAGMAVFNETCGRCHSSKPAPMASEDGYTWEQFEEFRKDNYFSDDKRYSISEVQTNMARALATNAKGPDRHAPSGHIWEDFSSQAYKDQPPAEALVRLFNPLNPLDPIQFQPSGGGMGYYRTPSLVGMWATAPYFHNNGLGDYVQDPSVDGRLRSFEDAIDKLLWPEKRLGSERSRS